MESKMDLMSGFKVQKGSAQIVTLKTARNFANHVPLVAVIARN